MPNSFSFPQKPRRNCWLILISKKEIITVVRERKVEREVKKKQRIKRDRMLTNFMSLFLEGRLFVWRFLIWDLSLSFSPSFSFSLYKKKKKKEKKRKNTIHLQNSSFLFFFFCFSLLRKKVSFFVWGTWESGPADRNLQSFVEFDEDLSFFNGVT